MAHSRKILVVDDELQIRLLLEEFLASLGYTVDVAEDGEQALEHLKMSRYAGVLTDLKMAKMGGMQLLKRIKLHDPGLPVIIITGYPSVEIAVEAMKEGAADFITKPLRFDELRMALNRITQTALLADQRSGCAVGPTYGPVPSSLPGKIKELSILYAISEVFQDSTDTETIFQRLIQVAREIAGTSSASFTIFDLTSKNVSLKTFYGSDQDHLSAIEEALQEDHFKRLINEQKPIYFINTHQGVILPVIIKNQILGALSVWGKQENLPFTEDEVLLLLTLCRKAALSLENCFLYESLYHNLLETLKALVTTLEARDPYTGAHSQRVSQYATALAAKLGCSKEEQDIIMSAGFLHDIGKIGICDAILLKTNPLTPTEYEVIKMHPVIGEQIVQPLAFFSREKAIIRHHHEWWDGRGYPDGLISHQIPFLVRIVTVVDAFDAITTNRPYRQGRSFSEGLAELQKWAGVQFDPEVVSAFRHVLEEDHTALTQSPSV